MNDFDCQETIRHVHEFLHQEMSEQDKDLVMAHLAQCDSCENNYEFEQFFNQVIERSCTEASVEELASRIMKRLRSIQNGESHA